MPRTNLSRCNYCCKPNEPLYNQALGLCSACAALYRRSDESTQRQIAATATTNHDTEMNAIIHGATMRTMKVSDIASQLETALADMKNTAKALEEAEAALAPLREAALTAVKQYKSLNNQLSITTGVGEPAAATNSRRKRSGGTIKQRTPEENVKIQESKARTIAEKAGKTKREIEKAGIAAGEKAAKKAGIPYPLSPK
jgi:hypothetical protein